MEKSVFQIKLPQPEDPGRRLLIIKGQSGPFGGGGSSTFWVDEVGYNHEDQAYYAYLDDRFVVSFSPETAFMVVSRDRISQLSQEEVFRHNAK